MMQQIQHPRHGRRKKGSRGLPIAAVRKIFLPTYLSTYLSTYLPACLPAYFEREVL
jgi:hypothetical protein